jgi:hypothetical protein
VGSALVAALRSAGATRLLIRSGVCCADEASAKALALRSLRSKLQIHLKISATVLALVNDVALTRYLAANLFATSGRGGSWQTPAWQQIPAEVTHERQALLRTKRKAPFG